MTLRIGNSSNSRRDRPSIKREQAEERKAAWDSISTKDKINILDSKLGKSIGAKKQRARLANELDKDKFTVKTNQKNEELVVHITDVNILNSKKLVPAIKKAADAATTPTPVSNEGTQDTENTITIFKSSEDDGFVAKIKGIKESARGATKAEARANAKRLINQNKQ